MSEPTAREVSSERREALEGVLRAHQIVATGLGEWCCKCSPAEWRATARRSSHFTDALAPLLAEWSAQDRAAGAAEELREASREITEAFTSTDAPASWFVVRDWLHIRRAALVVVALLLSLSGCGDAMYQKETPDVYPGQESCLGKGGDYDYDGYDGSWSCTLSNRAALTPGADHSACPRRVDRETVHYACGISVKCADYPGGVYAEHVRRATGADR